MENATQHRIIVGEREQVNVDKYRQRLQTYAGRYFHHHAIVDAASAYLSILEVCFEGVCFTKARQVHLFSYGEFHLVIAEGSCLQIESIEGRATPLDLNGYDSVMDWLYSGMLNEFYAETRSAPTLKRASIIGVAPVIYGAEYCLLDFTTEQEHFRQAFHQGKAVMTLERRQPSEFPVNAPLIAIQFTLDLTIFKSRLISIEQVRQGINLLKKERLLPKNLRIKTRKTSDYIFEVVVKPQPET